MKKQKKALTLVIVLMMIVSLFVGCKKEDSGSTTVTDVKSESNTAESNAGTAQESATDETETLIDFSEEPYEIVLELVTLGQDFTSLSAMEEAINAISLPATNTTIKFMPLHIADHGNKLNLMTVSGEKIDLVVTGITTPLPGLVAMGIVMPLDDLLDRAPELVEKQGDLLDAFTINGKIYSISANLYPATARGMMYNKDMADEYGIEVPERVTYAEIEKIAEQLHAANPELFITTFGDGGLNSYDAFDAVSNFGGDYNYGVIFDPMNNLEIENFYTSEQFKEYAYMIKDWKDKGYIPSDSITSGENGQDVFRAEQIFYQWSNVSPSNYLQQAGAWPFTLAMTQGSDVMLSTEIVQEFGLGISSTCERPDKVMDFLNLIYTNADVSNILNNGLEGLEYEKVSENIIKYVEGINFGNTGYVKIFNRFGDDLQTYQWAPATESYYDELKAFSDSAIKSKTLGYTFNADDVATELASVSSVVAEYRPGLLTGMFDDVDAALAEFNDALESAGINTIIEENKKQLDAWLAENN